MKWTEDSARLYIKRSKTKGLKYWSAYDFLVKIGAFADTNDTNGTATTIGDDAGESTKKQKRKSSSKTKEKEKA